MNKNSRFSATEWHKRFVQQTSWTTAIRNYLFNRLGLDADSRILEVGCGTCAVLSQKPISDYQTFGLDINHQYLSFANNHFNSLHLSQGDGHLLPYSSEVFDLVYCHYLLLWVNDPAKILREFKRVGKIGAKIMILAEPDYGGRIDYPPELEKLGIAQTLSLQNQGANPFIGRSLSQLVHSTGLRVIEFGVLGSQSTPTFDQDFLESEWTMLYYDLSKHLDEITLKRYRLLDQNAWADGTRVLFIPTFYLYAEII